MLPLDVVSTLGEQRNAKALEVALLALKSAGVEGVMGDVWWGLVERKGPKQYDWAPYKALLQMVRKAGLLMQAVMSFHACGNNVGDDTHIPLPPWVQDCFAHDPAIFYHDKSGATNPECISLFSDDVPCLLGRTPLEVYEDFMRSFKEAMGEDLEACVCEVAVGMGPCGELRYPSYPEGDGRWRFPGVGEFQCYDTRALQQLKEAAEALEEPHWGLSGPHDAGSYRHSPQETGFFRHPGGSWSTSYGQFFLTWYSDALVKHQERMLVSAIKAFHGVDLRHGDADVGSGRASEGEGKGRWRYEAPEHAVHLSVKCAGIHWWYQTASHAAELTAGYYNPWGRNGYKKIVLTCQRYGASLNFTCVEMRDAEQPAEAQCGPEELVAQVRACASRYGVAFSGENALARLDEIAYDQIVRHALRRKLTVVEMAKEEGALEETRSKGNKTTAGLCTRIVDYKVPLMSGVTFLRLTPKLFEERNFALFMRFVGRLKAGSAGAAEPLGVPISPGSAGDDAGPKEGREAREVVQRARSGPLVHGQVPRPAAHSYRRAGSSNFRGVASSSTQTPESPGGQTVLSGSNSEFLSCATPPCMRHPPYARSQAQQHLHHNPSYYHSYQQFPQPHYNHHIVHQHKWPGASASGQLDHVVSPIRNYEGIRHSVDAALTEVARSPGHPLYAESVGRQGLTHSKFPRGSRDWHVFEPHDHE